MRRRGKYLLLVMLLLMAVGFAAVTTTLVLNGTLTVGENTADFGIYFSKSILNDKDVSKETISTNGQTINFEAELGDIKNTAELEYEVTNASRNYDAKVSVGCQFKEINENRTFNFDEYLSINYPNIDEIIEARSTGKGTIKITLEKGVEEEIQVGLECKLDFEGVERESLGENTSDNNPSNYSLSGYLIDDEEEILPNTNIVILGNDNIYITSNEEAYLTIEGLDMGFHEIYIIQDKQLEEIKEMSNEEIKENSLTHATFTQSTKEITFENGYKIVDKVVKNKFTVTFNANGGEVTPTSKVVKNDTTYGELPTPTLEGYNFIGWYTDTEYTIEIKEYTKVELDEDQTLYAKWEAKEYTVTFNSDGGSEVPSKKVKYNSTYGELEIPTRKGYNFLGWYLNDTLITSTTKYTSLNDITLVAKWDSKKRLITVDIDGTPTEVEIDLTKPIKEQLPNVEKEGYDFEGWYKDDDTELEDNKYLEEDEEINIHTQFKAKKYTVTFNGNTGNVSTPSKEVTYDEEYGELPSATKNGYNFIGWFTSASGGEQVTEDTIVKITSNQTLYARYSAKEDIIYTVKHWQQKVGGSETPKNESNYTLINTETKQGTAGSTVEVNVNTYEGFTSPNKESIEVKGDGTSEVNYYYTRNSYTLTVNKDAGVSTVTNKASYQYGEEVTISYTIKEGYTFKDITGDKTTNTFTMPSSNVAISINTVENTYTITYELDGGEVSGTNPSEYKVTSNGITLKNPSKTGYTFTGWTGSNGGTANKNVTIAKGSTGNKTYTANWNANTYSVSFDTNGGNTVSTVLTVTYDGTYGSTLPTPTRTGYTFNGWYTLASGGNKVTSTTKVSITNNQTLYAHWTANTYTINYTLNSGTSGTNKPTSGTYDSVVTISNPTRTGYTFDGWTVTSGLNTSTAKYGTSNTTVTSAISATTTKVTAQYFKNLTTGNSVTLTANWTATNYTITYNLDGGTNNSNNPSSYNITSNEITLQAPTKTGYTFAGWTGSNGTTKQTSVKIAKGSTGNKTYTANWTAINYTVTLNAGTGGSVSASSISVPYGGTKTYTVTANSGYYLSSLSCTNGYTTNAKIGSNRILESGNLITSMTSLYSKGDPQTTQTVTISNNENTNDSTCTASFTSGSLAYDGTTDNNLRYIGTNPNNYVEFNGEKWRIIGVMNKVKDSNNNSASRVKIIRVESIGSYSWDNKPSGIGSSTTPYGSNDWTDSRLMTVLNSGPYWNRTSGTCPSGQNNATTSCNFSSNGLTTNAKQMISKVVWNLGGHSTPEATTSTFYTAERGTTVYSGHQTTWTGYVGLMYPSDYGYAAGGNVRSTCLSTNMSSYRANNCYTNDWLHLTLSNQWTILPYSNDGAGVLLVCSAGHLCYNYGYSADAVRPVVYLNTNIKMTGGKGTSDEPYIIALS